MVGGAVRLPPPNPYWKWYQTIPLCTHSLPLKFCGKIFSFKGARPEKGLKIWPFYPILIPIIEISGSLGKDPVIRIRNTGSPLCYSYCLSWIYNLHTMHIQLGRYIITKHKTYILKKKNILVCVVISWNNVIFSIKDISNYGIRKEKNIFLIQISLLTLNFFSIYYLQVHKITNYQ